MQILSSKLAASMAAFNGQELKEEISMEVLVDPGLVVKVEVKEESLIEEKPFIDEKEALMDLAFLGLHPNTMRDVLCEAVGLLPSWTDCTTSVRESPRMSQQV